MSPKQSLSSKDIETLNSKLQTLSPQTALVTSASNSAAYQQSLKRWSAAAVKPAAAVLIPTSLPQLQAVLSYCTENSIDVAVKGGGHSTAGASSTDGGLLIDLGNSSVYSKVTVDTHNKLLHAGGGALWGDVDTAAFAHGLVSVGGTVADTGVGGLTLGGGYGWLSGIIGLVIDNLVSVTLVTAQGEIVKASKEENEDLFWAMRGAGQNFGVVTEFVLQAHSYGSDRPDAIGGAKGAQAWAGMLFFDPESSPDVVEKVVTASNDLYRVRDFGQGGRTATAGLGAGGFAIAKPPPMGGKTVILVPIIYHGTEEKGREAYKELLDLGPMMSTVAMVDYPAINHLLDVPPGFRVSMKGASFTVPIRPEFVRECMSKFEEFVGRVNDAAGSLVLVSLIIVLYISRPLSPSLTSIPPSLALTHLVLSSSSTTRPPSPAAPPPPTPPPPSRTAATTSTA